MSSQIRHDQWVPTERRRISAQVSTCRKWRARVPAVGGTSWGELDVMSGRIWYNYFVMTSLEPNEVDRLTLTVEYMGADDHTPFWFDGFPIDPLDNPSGPVIAEDLLSRGMAWEATWMTHFRLFWDGAVTAAHWDSETVAFEWACEGIAIYREAVRQYPELEVQIDLWPIDADQRWTSEGTYWRNRSEVWTEAVGSDDFSPRQLTDIRDALIRVIQMRVDASD
jgi:hypothetical protein